VASLGCRGLWFAAALSIAGGSSACTRDNPAFGLEELDGTQGKSSADEHDGPDDAHDAADEGHDPDSTSTSRGEGDEQSHTADSIGPDDTSTTVDGGSEGGTQGDCPENAVCKSGETRECSFGFGVEHCVDCHWDDSACCECQLGDEVSCIAHPDFSGQGLAFCDQTCKWQPSGSCCVIDGASCGYANLECCTSATCLMEGGFLQCVPDE
jgi:hypothetical protein